MSTDNNLNMQPSNDVESLTLTLQQIAASAQTNTEQFESQKKQFFEQFSQLFGSLNTLKQQQILSQTTITPPRTITPPMTKPSNIAILSPSINIDGLNLATRTNTPKSNTSNTSNSIPNFKPSSSNPSVSNPNPANPSTNAFIPRMSALPLNVSTVVTPQAIPFQSVPMSIISNTSQSHSTVYQYPYITSGPNPALLSIPNLKSPNLNLSFTPTNTIKSQGSIAMSPNKPNLIPTYSNASTPSTASQAYESYWMRRVLSNILLLFFRYHPNGVLECELCQFYEQMFNERLVLTMDLKYLLCVHKSILITRTKERGQLYTLADDQISLFLQEFDTHILQQWIVKHIRRLFRCFPNGIACNCLQDLLYNMVEFKLADVIPNGKWHQFVCNIPTMYCCNMNGIDIFICIDLNQINKAYHKINGNINGGNNNVINSSNIQYYLSNYLNPKNILVRPVGYSELLTVLLSNYYTLDMSNPYYNGIDGETLEKAFHHQYQSRLVHEAPFIQDVLGKICAVFRITNSDGSETKLYKLVKSSKQYFDTQPDAFAPILHRSLELIPNNTMQPQQPLQEESNVPQSPFKEDHVSVFMGGFSHGTTVNNLRAELAKNGITMISSSGISYRNYGWSFVTLANDKEAQYLISISPIQIMGRNIDIRPFINRQRVRNHISNKPSDKSILNAIIELLNTKPTMVLMDGLTVADIQSKLFRKFSYRIDGPQLTKIVGDNPKYLYIKREKTERIYLTPKLSVNTSIEELKSKINKLWKHIQCNYRGNVYNIDTSKDDDSKEEITQAQTTDSDKIGEDMKESNTETLTLKTVLSNTSTEVSSKSSKPRSRRGKRKIKESEPTHTISENDFENEFARRYRFAVCANHFGFNTVKQLLDSLTMPFKCIIYECVCDDSVSNNGYVKTKPYTTVDANRSFNKNNLNINLTSPNINNPNSNMTSPRYINSPSVYSNYSNHSHSYSNRIPVAQSYNHSYCNDNQRLYSNSNSTPSQPQVSVTPNQSYSPAQLLQYQQYAIQQQQQQQRLQLQNVSKMGMPYVIGGNSMSNYSIIPNIPSVPNSIITANNSLQSAPNMTANNNNINLNTIHMNINMAAKNAYGNTVLARQNIQSVNNSTAK